MKTTVELNDELLIEAKKLAAEKRTTLRNLIEQGLRERISRQKGRRKKALKIRWITARGGLPEGTEIRSRETMMLKLGRKI